MKNNRPNRREARNRQLEQQGIHTIPQALAVQRFSDEATRQRSQGIVRNLQKAGFSFDLGRASPDLSG